MASRLYKRFAVPAATALSMTALLAGTAQALPVTQQQDATVFTIGQDGMTLNKGTSKGNSRLEYTSAPQELSGPTRGYIMIAGKQTKPANARLFTRQPGYNPYQFVAPMGKGPDKNSMDSKEGFKPEQLATLYRSDVPKNISYSKVISGFYAAMDRADIKTANANLVMSINNNARLVQIQRAVADSNDENLITMSDALGTRLGKIYRDLYIGGKLVKLQQLVGGDMSRAFNFTNATGLEKAHYRNPRPFKEFPEHLKYYYETQGDFNSDKGYSGLALSYPSGHTNRAYIKGIILAAVFPEFAPQLLARASEVGFNRVVMGVHYPLDTVAGRMTGTASMAWHFADKRFYPLIAEAARDTRAIVEKACGTTIMKCWKQGKPFLSEAESIRVYTARMNYNLPNVGKAGQPMTVPETASALLLAKYPQLTDAQRDRILMLSSMDSGSPLDFEGQDGFWQRINLAKALSAHVKQLGNGAIQVRFAA